MKYIQIYIITPIFFILLTNIYFALQKKQECFSLEVPSKNKKKLPPFTANKYYDKLYLQKFNIMNSREYNPLEKPLGQIMPLNSEDYPNFKNNFDVYGSIGKALNPDLPMKKIVPHFTSLKI